MPDSHYNFAYSTVATAPSPASSGTTLTVAAGQGALFPPAPFNITVWPVGVQPTTLNAEIMRVGTKTTDTFSNITRSSESTSARTVILGDQVIAGLTVQTITDIETALASVQALSMLQAAQIAAREVGSEGYAVNSGGALSPNASALTAVSSTIASSLFNKTTHGLVANDTIVFTGLSTTTGVTNGVVYFVSATSLTANAFRVAATAGGTAITLGGTTDAAITVTQVGKLNIASGFDLFAGVQTAVSAVTAISTTIASMADATNPKWVAVELSDGTTINFNQGTAAASPAFPSPTASRVVHGWLYIPAAATQVDALLTTVNGNAKFIDARVIQGSIYALLLGRSGGQTLTGDTASGGNLTLMSTAHATKGKILFGTSGYDEVNNRLGIGTASPAGPLDAQALPTINSATFNVAALTATADAASATTTSATFRGSMVTLATGNVATAFTGSLVGHQAAVVHNSSGSAINVATIYGFLAAASLGTVASVNTPTVTSMFGGQFQAVNRSDTAGTAVSTEMTGVSSSVSAVGRGTVALLAGYRAILTSVANSAPASTTPPTTTLEVGYDLGFSFHTAGTITTAIGLRLQAWPAGPTYTNGPYGLSVEGTGSLNYIAGKTQIGGSSRPTSISPYLLVKGSILSDTAAGGIGYATGSGGTVTQATSKSTGVTLNTVTGVITMNGAAMTTATTVGFTLTNSSIAATDVVVVNMASAATANSYTMVVDAVAAGSCHISVRNFTGGTLSEAIVINFAVVKGVSS